MEITVKVAIEDLEKSIENKSTKELDDLSNNQENINSEKLILEYFRNNLTFSLLDNTKEFKWVGKETSNNLHDIYLYFEIPDCNSNANIASITIENTLFLERSHKQTNIVLVEFGDLNFNLTFTKDYTKERVVF